MREKQKRACNYGNSLRSYGGGPRGIWSWLFWDLARAATKRKLRSLDLRDQVRGGKAEVDYGGTYPLMRQSASVNAKARGRAWKRGNFGLGGRCSYSIE